MRLQRRLYDVHVVSGYPYQPDGGTFWKIYFITRLTSLENITHGEQILGHDSTPQVIVANFLST